MMSTLGCALTNLNAMNNAVLWMIGMTLGHELNAIDAMNN